MYKVCFSLLTCTLYVLFPNFVCTKYVLCMNQVWTKYVVSMKKVCTEYVLGSFQKSRYIQASSFVEQFSCSLYWVHTLCIRPLAWKRPSSIFQIKYTDIAQRSVQVFALSRILDQLTRPIATSKGRMDWQKYPKHRLSIRKQQPEPL